MFRKAHLFNDFLPFFSDLSYIFVWVHFVEYMKMSNQNLLRLRVLCTLLNFISKYDHI